MGKTECWPVSDVKYFFFDENNYMMNIMLLHIKFFIIFIYKHFVVEFFCGKTLE